MFDETRWAASEMRIWRSLEVPLVLVGVCCGGRAGSFDYLSCVNWAAGEDVLH